MKVPFFDLTVQHGEVAEGLTADFARVMQSGWYILGPELESFEAAYANYIGTKHAIGVGNGLDALTLTLRGLGIGEGDEVIVPTHTAIATWLAVSQARAKLVPVLTDEHYVLDANRLAEAITPKTRAVMPVHLYGHPADMDAIASVIGGRDIAIVEDVAQGQGCKYKGKMSGGIGRAAGFSFYPTKNLGALGDGGAITTNDDALAAKLRRLRNYGSVQKYVHDIQGTNSRLDELQAALLKTKLPHLDRWNEARRKVAAIYKKELAACAHVTLPEVASWAEPVWHQFVVRCKNRDALQAHLKENGVDTLIHYPIPNHLQGAYKGEFSETAYAPYAAMTAEILSLPIYPALGQDKVHHVCEVVKSFSG